MSTSREAEAALRPRLTDEVLGALVEAAKVIGWSVDHVETADFVHECFRIAGKAPPSREALEPYDFEAGKP